MHSYAAMLADWTNGFYHSARSCAELPTAAEPVIAHRLSIFRHSLNSVRCLRWLLLRQLPGDLQQCTSLLQVNGMGLTIVRMVKKRGLLPGMETNSPPPSKILRASAPRTLSDVRLCQIRVALYL
jgi:hypothetical protein